MYVIKTITDTLANTKDTFLEGCSDIKEAFCDFLDEDTTIKRKTIAIIVIVATIIGLIYGLIIAPKKKVVVEMCDCTDSMDDGDWE